MNQQCSDKRRNTSGAPLETEGHSKVNGNHKDKRIVSSKTIPKKEDRTNRYLMCQSPTQCFRAGKIPGNTGSHIYISAVTCEAIKCLPSAQKFNTPTANQITINSIF